MNSSDETAGQNVREHSELVAELIEFINANACTWSKVPDPGGEQWGIHLHDTPPHNRLLGPVFERGETCGVIQQQDKTLVSWGDIHRADMTFSVTKTYLALCAGIAFDQGLIADLDQVVVDAVPDIGFDDGRNRQITWRHLLQFTSEWEGHCFGVPDQVDRYREVSMHPVAESGRKGDARPLHAPGTYWEYNDVRMNQFALALLYVFRRPLPEVFSEFVMQPLGCSETWRWHGYANSWLTIDNREVQSVPGGGHWGGGMVMSASDQALVARLLIDRGRYGNQQLISSRWIDQMLTPCEIAPHYGFFTWLNTDHGISRSVPAESYFAMGIGGQVIWQDPTREVLAVFRWIDMNQLEPMLKRVQVLLAPPG